MNCAEAEPLLGAYLDRELDLQGSLAIERHIDSCVQCAAQFRALERLHAETGGAALDYTPRPDWRVRIGAASEAPGFRWARSGWPVWAALAAACVLLVLAPWRQASPEPEIAREIVDNHIRSLSGSHLVDVPSSDRHTVKPWFQGKTSFAPTVPDLAADGFPLIGGRLDILQQQRVAALVYKRGEHVINLFIAPLDRRTEDPKTWDSGGYHVLSWVRGGFGYWAVSDMNPPNSKHSGIWCDPESSRSPIYVALSRSNRMAGKSL